VLSHLRNIVSQITTNTLGMKFNVLIIGALVLLMVGRQQTFQQPLQEIHSVRIIQPKITIEKLIPLLPHLGYWRQHILDIPERTLAIPTKRKSQLKFEV
jgi:hypothetical protein